MSNRLPILAAQIQVAHQEAVAAVRTAAERAIEAGHALLEAKSLVKHGEWLPWLKQHARISERSAQFYMKIAKLGLKSETVAVLGIKAASEAIVLAYPDPFAQKTDEDNREWALYMLYGVAAGIRAEDSERACHWLARNGWNTPDEWQSETGDRYRAFWKLRPISQAAKDQWKVFRSANEHRTFDDLKAELQQAAERPE